MLATESETRRNCGKAYSSSPFVVLLVLGFQTTRKTSSLFCASIATDSDAV